MWNTITLGDDYYLMQVFIGSENVVLKISDLKSIWIHEGTKDEIIKQFKANNPLNVESSEDIFQRCINLFNDNSTIIGVDFESNYCTLNFKVVLDLDGLTVKLSLKLLKQSDENYLKEVAIPMVQTIQYLELKQNKLETLLANKDKELSEYKLEYGEITRKVVETEPYVPDDAGKEELFLGVFSKNEKFTQLFSRLFGEIQQLFPEVYVKKAIKRKLQLAPTKTKQFSS